MYSINIYIVSPSIVPDGRQSFLSCHTYYSQILHANETSVNLVKCVPCVTMCMFSVDAKVHIRHGTLARGQVIEVWRYPDVPINLSL